MPKERDIIKIIWTNFRNSLRPRQIKGNLIGKDRFGNKYLEIPPNPSIGKPRKERWFEPVDKEAFDEQMPAEWEAWLRNRRTEPPTEEELLKSQAIADMKKENAAELEGKNRHPDAPPKKAETMQDFPIYKDYELPGKPKDNK